MKTLTKLTTERRGCLRSATLTVLQRVHTTNFRLTQSELGHVGSLGHWVKGQLVKKSWPCRVTGHCVRLGTLLYFNTHISSQLSTFAVSIAPLKAAAYE